MSSGVQEKTDGTVASILSHWAHVRFFVQLKSCHRETSTQRHTASVHVAWWQTRRPHTCRVKSSSLNSHRYHERYHRFHQRPPIQWLLYSTVVMGRLRMNQFRRNDSLTRMTRPDSPFQFSPVRLVRIVRSPRLDSHTHPLVAESLTLSGKSLFVR